MTDSIFIGPGIPGYTAKACDSYPQEYIARDTVNDMIRQAVEDRVEHLVDEIWLYRVMRKAKGRKRIDYARAIAAAIRASDTKGCV